MHVKHHSRGDTHRYECWGDYGCSVVAVAVVQLRGGRAHLQDISVGRGHRGRGIGSDLLKRIVADFKDRPITAKIFKARVPWYRRHGFEPVGREKELVEVARSP